MYMNKIGGGAATTLQNCCKYAKRKGGKGIGFMDLSLGTSRIGGLRHKASLLGGERSD